ncbi:MAG: glycosyltransferase family 2 protein [Desulfomonilaceae bacterium]
MSVPYIPVSVCLVTYNRAHILPQTVDSILNQTFEDFELIISDDCSSDGTREVCGRYLAQDSRVKYFRNEANLGMPGNLKAAIAKSQGNYIANLHDGDIYRRDLLEKWVAALNKYPTAGFVFNHYEHLDIKGNPTSKIARRYDGELIPGRRLIEDILKAGASPVWGTVMVRRSAYEEVGEFDAQFGHLADVDMWLRLATRYDVAHVPEPLIAIRQREKNHPWINMKWQHIRWSEDILFTNMSRIYGSRGKANSEIWNRFLRGWDSKVVRWLVADLIPNQFRTRFGSGRQNGRLGEAVDFLVNSKSPRLTLAGKTLSRVLRRNRVPK